MKVSFELEQDEAEFLINSLGTVPAGRLLQVGYLQLLPKLNDQLKQQIEQIQKTGESQAQSSP